MDRELIAYLDERFGRIDERFEKIDGRFEKIDGRFEKIDGRFEKIDGRFEAMDSRMDRLEDGVRGARVEIEALRGDIRLIAEGVSMGFDEVLKPLRQDVATQIDDLRKTLHTSQSDLHRRVGILEDWKQRTIVNDPIAIIRERFGIKPNS